MVCEEPCFIHIISPTPVWLRRARARDGSHWPASGKGWLIDRRCLNCCQELLAKEQSQKYVFVWCCGDEQANYCTEKLKDILQDTAVFKLFSKKCCLSVWIEKQSITVLVLFSHIVDILTSHTLINTVQLPMQGDSFEGRGFESLCSLSPWENKEQLLTCIFGFPYLTCD